MSRGSIAVLSAVALLAAGVGWYLVGPSAKRPMADGPNVLIILWDTTRADKMSLYGFPKPTTPNLDRFAKEAVVFDRAISPAMWTPPSHASLFTGYAPTHHGVEATNKWLDSYHITLAEWLGQSGYDTYAFSANPFVSRETNLMQGFDVAENAFTGDWKREARKATKSKMIPTDASTDISPAWKAPPGQQSSGVAHAFKEAAGVAHEALVKWLGEREEPERPWFAFLNMMEVHIPRVPSMASRKLVMTDAQIQTSLQTDVAQINLLAHTFGKKLYTPEQIEAINGVYEASLIDMDRETGAMLDDLRAKGLLENTVVILTADHGDNLGDHGMFGHKYNVYDTLLHVPLVIWYPQQLQPRRVSFPVSNLNLFTTILDLVGIAPPDTEPESKGSLLTLAAPVPVFSELNETTPISIQRVAKTYGLNDASRYIRSFRAVEVDGWKLIRASDNAHELYNLKSDPDELNNLYAAEPARGPEMIKLIDDWLTTVKPYDCGRRTEQDKHKPSNNADVDMLKQLGYVNGEEGDEEHIPPMPVKALKVIRPKDEESSPCDKEQ